MIQPPGTDQIRATIVRLTEEHGARGFGLSDVARAIDADWEPLMDGVRAETMKLADEGIVDVTQGGLPVDARSARGAIRIRRARPPQ